jgi:hypothetical protein
MESRVDCRQARSNHRFARCAPQNCLIVGSLTPVIWFQLGSNEGPLNRHFFGISGADSTILRFVNSRMLLYNLRGTLWIFGGTAARKADALNLMHPFTRPLCTPEAFSVGTQTLVHQTPHSRWGRKQFRVRIRCVDKL